MGLDLELMAIKIDTVDNKDYPKWLDIYFKTIEGETAHHFFPLTDLDSPERILVINPNDENICKLIDLSKRRKEEAPEVLSKISEAIKLGNYEVVRSY